MENNTQNTEIVADTEKVGVNLRESLESRFDTDDEKASIEPVRPSVTKSEPSEEAVKTTEPNPITSSATTDRAVVAPPADMRKEEREAFLNPTSENAHILQSYLSRRAYETRTDYARKTQEVEQTRQKLAALNEVVSQYEPEYARYGMNIADITRRSIEWDKAMQANPVQTALEWLDSYGVELDDLQGYLQNGGQIPQQQQQYLTAADAERIAQEKIEGLLQQQQQSAVAYNNYQAVQSFIADKPLFKDPGTAQQLEDAMAPIVAALANNGQSPQEILETAYNYVTKGNPTFSALTQKLEAPQVVEQKVREAQKAKAATKSITGSAGSGSPRLQTKDIRTNLQRRFYGGD